MRPKHNPPPAVAPTALRVESWMTPGAYSVRPGDSLDAAHELMRDHRIRHLPVIDDGRLVGILSQRDLHLLESLASVDPAKVPVEDAMSPRVYAVPLGAPLARVAEEMAERRIGSAVVMDGREVAGIFTTVDALRALSDVLRRPG